MKIKKIKIKNKKQKQHQKREMKQKCNIKDKKINKRNESVNGK
jgi:hypothetical protein